MSSHELLPPAKPIDYSKLSSKKDIDLIEFQQGFYSKAFRDPNMRPSDLEPLNLRLCAFVDLKEERVMDVIPFS